jgi:hypothetical protein
MNEAGKDHRDLHTMTDNHYIRPIKRSIANRYKVKEKFLGHGVIYQRRC